MLSPLPVYYGNSMAGVFTPGDRLRFVEVPFSQLQAGDVVAIEADSRQYVHRVIDLMDGAAITMGDNNAGPDRQILTPESHFFRVVEAVSPNGRCRPVYGGRAGMRLFRRNQFRRKLRRMAGRVWYRLEPFAFWRLHARGRTEFRQETVFDFHGIPVARATKDQSVHYCSPLKRLLFKLPERPRGRKT